jgi:hypothetical protein
MGNPTFFPINVGVTGWDAEENFDVEILPCKQEAKLVELELCLEREKRKRKLRDNACGFAIGWGAASLACALMARQPWLHDFAFTLQSWPEFI